MTQALQELKDYLEVTLAENIASMQLDNKELTIVVTVYALLKVLVFLRDDANCQFQQLVFITGADYPDRSQRFDIIYHLLSLRYNQRIRVKLKISAGVLVPSATYIFSSANWFEREIWDMYGIVFDGHPDLRRLLTDYGFDGHPLRKDFPLTGYLEVRYDDKRKRVVYESVKLMQEFRVFDFLSPWEGGRFSGNKEQ